MNKIITVVGIFITMCYLCVACNNKLEATKVVEEWKGKRLSLPNDSLKLNIAEHRINPLSKKIKVLTTINASCGSCINELKNWKDFMDNIDTSKVGFVFLFYSNDNLMAFEEINQSNVHFLYPYFHDREKMLITKNNISDDKRYQTFLLDSTNRVILVGNPINKQELSILYQTEIKRLTNLRVERKPGVTLTYEPGRVKLNFDEEVVFKDENGNRLSKKEVREMSAKYNCWLEQKSPTLVIVRKQPQIQNRN